MPTSYVNALESNDSNFTKSRIMNYGDSLFPKIYEVQSQAYLHTQGLEIPVAIGLKKLVSYKEFLNDFRIKTELYRLYYLNSPPLSSIAYEDPNNEMLRIYVPLAREVVNKGAKFLFGKGRFFGSASFVFEKGNQTFQKEFDKFWKDNKMDVLLKRVARTNLWSGRCFLKMFGVTDIESSLVLPDGENKEAQVKEKAKNANIQVLYTDPEHWRCVSFKDNPKQLAAWIYEFRRQDGTFYREEIYRDMTFIYEGVLTRTVRETEKVPIAIAGSGFREIVVTDSNEKIEYTLVAIINYPELDDFPVVPFFNESDFDNDGTSVYQGLTGKFDALNDLFTRTFFALQHQATPLLWMSGVKQGTDADVHTPDAIWVLEDKDAELHVLQWEGTPDAVFKFYEEMKDLIYKSVGVPKSSDLKAFTNISGEALNSINTDIVDTTNDRRLDYEDSFRTLVRLLRKMLKQAKPIEEDMEIIWGAVFPESKDKIGETVVTLARERLIHRSTAILLHPHIPEHMKEQLMKEAKELEDTDQALKEKAIEAQTARVGQRAGGQTAERGKAKPTK